MAPSGEIESLALLYRENEVVPPSSVYDALHVACASVNDLDFILSLNFKHIHRTKTQQGMAYLNQLHGYRTPVIQTPMEVIHYDD